MREFSGAAGTVIEVPQPAEFDAGWQSQCAVGRGWLCNCPGQAAFWDQYALFMIHLRDVEGQDKPPHLDFEGATHEVLLYAIDPGGVRVTPANFYHEAPRRQLTPINIAMQVADLTDQQAETLLDDIAKAIAVGRLTAEPPFPAPKTDALWRNSLDATAAHHRGEH